MCWIAILNPTHETFEEVKPLLSGAYERAVERFSSRIGQHGALVDIGPGLCDGG